MTPFATELEEVRSTDLGKARDIWEGREIVISLRGSTWKERPCESCSTARCSLIGLPAFSATNCSMGPLQGKHPEANSDNGKARGHCHQTKDYAGTGATKPGYRNTKYEVTVIVMTSKYASRDWNPRTSYLPFVPIPHRLRPRSTDHSAQHRRRSPSHISATPKSAEQTDTMASTDAAGN